MFDGRKRILSPFTGCKNVKLGIRLEKNICWKKADKFYRKQIGDEITNQE